ncbi:GWT1-domain-containing protein [Pyronema domesticum]|uniref:GPI-anchored wall transfer protein n=1 Tax=Pyronema omphalodes (strain CBS 100304) TaxID=1076935 RepID=U4LW45_PYROM|nr:GWT1-domain-containing protein [Pyronema domesticum]CCX33156.1 Similar to GPI-anchored wall transfer protein 1; acc. no. Q7SCL1 [Pyronema omphalodes CBS 100304]
MKTPEELYKLRKEAFVSNLTGGSIGEINLVTAIAPVTYILFAILQSRLRLFSSYGLPQYILDFVLSALLLLYATTLYSSQPALLNAAVLLPALLAYFTTPPKATKGPKKPPTKSATKPAKPVAKTTSKGSSDETTLSQLPKKPFLTVYRGSMMVITCVAILAVDFPIFPRRFAKVENWGTSLMDLGVGSFVFSSGVVSARSILRSSPPPLLQRLKTSLRHSFPLLVLGLVRLIMVKGVDYAEHVTEYGVHWNFFFTLGFLPPFVAILQSLAGKGGTFSYAAIALGVSLAYETALHSTGLMEFVLVGDRHAYGLISLNKEGISSFLGYLAIFLTGMSTGTYVLPRTPDAVMFRKLVGWGVFWVAAFCWSTGFWGAGLGVSRRLANLPYVLWVAAFNTVQLGAFWAIERGLLAGKKEKVEGEKTKKTEEEEYKFATPKVLGAYNRNGLAVFLVANLLTGVVNMTVKTLDVNRMVAMGVLTAYLTVLTGFALVLDHLNLDIKL